MTWVTKTQDRTQWHRWFAWYPVRVSCVDRGAYWQSQWVWLAYVGCKVTHGYGDSVRKYREFPE